MMDASEIELVRASVRNLLETTKPADIADRLRDDGWVDLLADDPEVAIGTLGDEMGRSLAAAPLVDLALQHGLGLGDDPEAAVVLPPLRRGMLAAAHRDVDGLVLDGLLLCGREHASQLVVATADGVVRVAATGLEIAPVASVDPQLGLHAVTGRTPMSPYVADAAAWARALSFGHRGVASELIGLAAQMLGDTTAYVLAREQYGRAIGSFQTVKHRLADVHVAIVAARAGLAASWADGTEISALAAHCLAARAEQLASTHCHQVHGGIAFTVEHGFHRFIRRGQSIRGLLGHPDDLVRIIGAQLVAERRVPRTPQLT